MLARTAAGISVESLVAAKLFLDVGVCGSGGVLAEDNKNRLLTSACSAASIPIVVKSSDLKTFCHGRIRCPAGPVAKRQVHQVHKNHRTGH